MMNPETKKLRRAAYLHIFRQIKELCGPAPVLATESIKAYNLVMLNFIECFSPRDFMEQMLMKQLTDNTWLIIRYTRYQTLHVELNKFRDDRAQSGKSAETPTELAYAKAAERGIDQIKYLDELLNTATARRNDTLAKLDWYREGLARDLLFVSDKIIEPYRPHRGPPLLQPNAKSNEVAVSLGLEPDIEVPEAPPASEIAAPVTPPASEPKENKTPPPGGHKAQSNARQTEAFMSDELANLLGLGPEMAAPQAPPASEPKENEVPPPGEHNGQSDAPRVQTQAIIPDEPADFPGLASDMAAPEAPPASEPNANEALPLCADKPQPDSREVSNHGGK